MRFVAQQVDLLGLFCNDSQRRTPFRFVKHHDIGTVFGQGLLGPEAITGAQRERDIRVIAAILGDQSRQEILQAGLTTGDVDVTTALAGQISNS